MVLSNYLAEIWGISLVVISLAFLIKEKHLKRLFAAIETEDNLLKIKPKAPKSAKPSTKSDEKIKPDFCKLITNDSSIGKSFVFEKEDFKNAEITHTFFINEMVLPHGETDFAKVREMAKRKGKIVRKALIDGETIVSEKEFEA